MSSIVNGVVNLELRASASVRRTFNSAVVGNILEFLILVACVLAC